MAVRRIRALERRLFFTGHLVEALGGEQSHLDVVSFTRPCQPLIMGGGPLGEGGKGEAL